MTAKTTCEECGNPSGAQPITLDLGGEPLIVNAHPACATAITARHAEFVVEAARDADLTWCRGCNVTDEDADVRPILINFARSAACATCRAAHGVGVAA